ncbi:MAG TPA: hypothetical protein VGE01_14520 [Fimbriimonas sp.]
MSEDLFLSSIILVCAVMVVFNIVQAKRRGPSAYLLAMAFLAFGATLYAYQKGASQVWLTLGGVVVALLLGADFFYRTSQPK